MTITGLDEDDMISTKTGTILNSGDRPPSVLLEAVTLRTGYNAIGCNSFYSSSTALKVPKNCFSVKM